MPEWIHQSVIEERKEDPLVSTGKRLRKQVNYKELTDAQAFKQMDLLLDDSQNESDGKRPKRSPQVSQQQDSKQQDSQQQASDQLEQKSVTGADAEGNNEMMLGDAIAEPSANEVKNSDFVIMSADEEEGKTSEK